MSKELAGIEAVEVIGTNDRYVAPQIEKVITPGDLEREVHYAGVSDGISIGQT